MINIENIIGDATFIQEGEHITDDTPPPQPTIETYRWGIPGGVLFFVGWLIIFIVFYLIHF